MDDAAFRTVLWVATSENGSRDPLAGDVEGAGYRTLTCGVATLEETLSDAARAAGQPGAIVIDRSVAHPLRVARRAYRLAPLSHLVFLAEEERRAQLRREMLLAPMIGTYWSIVDAEPRSLLAALESSLAASRQRRQLRTSLDAINLRLANASAPRDSDEYRKLVISDRYLASITEHAPDAIVSLDPRGRIVTWNRGAEAMFGHDVQAAERLQLESLAAAGERGAVASLFATAVGGKPVVQREVECLRASGETFYAEMTLAPVRDDTGAIIAVSLTARDVTENRRNREELQRIRAELERRVAERTEALEAVNHELEAFTYSASHDLRAPLRGIDGFSQALLEDYGDALDETASRYLERVRAGARRMGEIIDSMLTLSRISRTELHFATVDLSGLARDIERELRENEPHRRATLHIERGLHCRGDRRLLRLALENLLGNAWKFTRERELGEIEFGRVADAEEPTFFVRDNGAGFDMTYAEKLFMPFQRLHQPQRFEGTGIGLGTVQRVITRHGGRVWAESEPDRGAIFYFSVPAGPRQVASVHVERPA